MTALSLVLEKVLKFLCAVREILMHRRFFIPGAIAAFLTVVFPFAAQAQRVYRGVKVTAFQGNYREEWKDQAVKRLEASVWTFYPNGTFVFAPENSDNYYDRSFFPIKGTYSLQNNVIQFQARKRNSWNTFVNIRGDLFLGAGQPKMQFTWISGSSYGAVVNQQKFGNSVQKEFIITLLVQ